MKSKRRNRETTEVLHGPGQLLMSMCPCCGDLQVTIPLEGSKRISVSIEHPKLLVLIAELVTMAHAFSQGTLKVPDFMPIECCEAMRRN